MSSAKEENALLSNGWNKWMPKQQIKVKLK